jgi:uroporphyrinogen decarboxylase
LPPVECVRGDPEAVGRYVDEWGCEFVTLQKHVMGEVKSPLIRSYASDLDKVRPPYAWVELDRDAVNRSCAASPCFMALLAPIRPFERMQFLRGTENLLIDLLRQPAAFLKLRDRIHAWAVALLERWVQTDVDALVWFDDWGSQSSLLIRPAMWRELFKPLYADYVRILHGAGKLAFMHSDGCIMDIYEDLIEIGVDAINSQLFCLDIEELGRRFAGRTTFWGEIDRQHVLASSSPEDSRAAVRRVARALYRGHGGVVAQCEFGPGARPENVRAVFDEWNRVGAAYA